MTDFEAADRIAELEATRDVWAIRAIRAEQALIGHRCPIDVVAPDPDPAEEIEAMAAITAYDQRIDLFRRLLSDGIIAPGPNL